MTLDTHRSFKGALAVIQILAVVVGTASLIAGVWGVVEALRLFATAALVYLATFFCMLSLGLIHVDQPMPRRLRNVDRSVDPWSTPEAGEGV